VAAVARNLGFFRAGILAKLTAILLSGGRNANARQVRALLGLGGFHDFIPSMV
jgi:hypothetical protein